MRFYLPIFSLLVMMMACEFGSNQDPLHAEVEQLRTIEQHQAFLERIYQLDQEPRKRESEIQQTFGHNSPEHQAQMEKIMQTDAENLQKIQTYLSVHGYPQPNQVGELAASAPWIVIHHAPDYESRTWAFPYFYEAYQHGYLEEGQFSFYLNRMYRMQSGGEEYPVESPFREADRIQGIIDTLNLKTK